MTYCEGANAEVTTETRRTASGRSYARCPFCGRTVRVVAPSLDAIRSNHLSGAALYAMHDRPETPERRAR